MVYIIPYHWFFLVIFLIDLLLLLLIFFGWGRGLCILSCHGFEPILRKQSFNWRYRMTCFCLSVYEIKFLFFFPAVTSVPGVVFSCSSVIMHCVPVCCLYFTPVWYSSLCCSPYFCFFFLTFKDAFLMPWFCFNCSENLFIIGSDVKGILFLVDLAI